ncbi:MAG: zinc metallopeptidase [Gammaproteobacteria bacterium]|nr:zinc metallopeptidase [Gammaproteobacteria bacterium]MCZ6855950.1 zinc metallopeptidase [Gammaproteobacteria bacterium]
MLIVLMIAVLALIFGPSIWVKLVMRANATEIPDMPGTGGELAGHLISRLGLDGVIVESSAAGDHYDPSARAVRLSPGNFEGRSLTAIAVAAHEVGHAIQHHNGDRHLAARTQLAPVANTIAKVSVYAISLAPVIGLITRHPVPFSLLFMLGISGLVARMVVHLFTLPTEWDASFGKALPILIEGQYIAPAEQQIVKKVLRAAALTYFAAALADILNLARWAAILLRR